nr:lactate utilization protein [uncultured Gellertiella sp.]
MDSRKAILARIRATRQVAGDDGARHAAVAARLAAPPQGIIPARGQKDAEGRIALFLQMIEKAGATHERLADPSAIPHAVASYLRAHNLPASLRKGGDPRLSGIGWDSQPALTLLDGASDGHDLAAISHAEGGIAETGTLMLLSGPDNPVTLTFLPEHHLVVISARDIGGDMETALARLRHLKGKDSMPRTVNFVSGPSRSADIEQTILLGAHGPRALHVLVVG